MSMTSSLRQIAPFCYDQTVLCDHLIGAFVLVSFSLRTLLFASKGVTKLLSTSTDELAHVNLSTCGLLNLPPHIQLYLYQFVG